MRIGIHLEKVHAIHPKDPEEIALKMLEVLNDTTRSELRSKAVKQAEKFSWEKCARLTLQVFSEIALR